MNGEVKPKRKTTTSTAVKARYNKKTYDRITICVAKDKAQAFKAKCAECGVSQAQILKDAIDRFLEK